MNLPPEQQEWLFAWELCSSQRYGQGMCLGTLIHSEIWNNLRELGVNREDRYGHFRIVLKIDDIFREYAEKAKTRDPASNTDGLRTMVEGRQAEMERGTKAI